MYDYSCQWRRMTPCVLAAIVLFAACLIPATAADKPAQMLSVKDFGVVGDGVADDTADIQTANTAAHAAGSTLWFPHGTYKVNGSFEIDASKCAWAGDKAVLKPTAAPTTPIIHLFSSASYDGTRTQNRAVLSGFVIQGNGSGSPWVGTALLIGHKTYTRCSLFAVRDVSIDGFTTAIQFTDNAWRVEFDHLYVRWGDVVAEPGLANAGEDMNFYGCMFSDKSMKLSLGTGTWHLFGCSIDNASIVVTGGAQVFCHGCHFENPASSNTGYRMVSIEAKQGEVTLRDCTLVINKPGANNFEWSPFYVDSVCTEKGLLIDGLSLDDWSYWTPEVHDTNRLLVAGTGRAVVRNIKPNTGSGNEFHHAYSLSMNSLYNYDFEEGRGLKGWPTSGNATIAAADDQSKTGSHSARLSSNGSQTGEMYQEFRAKPGELVAVVGWLKASGSGGNLQATLTPYTSDGTAMASISTDVFNSTVDWRRFQLGGVCPPGTASVRVRFVISGAFTAWIDSVIANVV